MSKLRKALIAALILTFGYFAYMTVSGTSFGGGSYSGAEPRKVFGSRIATMVATKDSVMTIVETGIPVVATEEIAAILPATDPLYKRRYSKCAVVGNSAILLHQGRGEEIDKHDMVMRFNWPKLGDKYGPDYGLKTDIMLVGASVSLHNRFVSSSYHNFSRDITVVSHVHDYDQWTQLAQNKAEGRATPHHQYAFSRFLIDVADSLACGKTHSSKCQSSTGLKGVVMAATICDHVDVYGFGLAARYGFAPYYLKTPKTPSQESVMYNYDKEFVQIQLIAARRKVTPLIRFDMATLRIQTTGIVGPKDFKRAFSDYPHLMIYNENKHSNGRAGFEEDGREPPLVDRSDIPSQRKEVARVHAHVNEGKPPSQWDYRHHYKIKYSNEQYTKGAKIGHGTYGDVYKNLEKVKGQDAVLKYLKPQKKRPWIYNREIMLLEQLKGKKNCIELLDVTLDGNHTVVVMPMVHITDFHSVYIHFEDVHIRYYTYKLFEALAYAHSMGIFHNDIKPLNVLLDSQTHELKVVDWGLGELYFAPDSQTNPNYTLSFHVGTRHWKAPELLLGSHHYSYAVDVWSAGCTFVGMLYHRTHFFMGDSNREQIVVITEVMGTEALDNYISKYQVPIDKKWYAKNIGQWRKKSWASMFTASTMKFYNADLEDLLDHMMVMDPEERWSAQEILDHKYFDLVRDLDEPPEWIWEHDNGRKREIVSTDDNANMRLGFTEHNSSE